MMITKLVQNPFFYLFQKTWTYAKGKRHILVGFMLMLVVANILVLMEPLVIGYILSTIQREGIHSSNVIFLLSMLASIIAFAFGIWCFHGPARVLEMNLAFWIEATYKKYLLDGVIHLPMSWHTDHHSGDTIDKVNKGGGALYAFAHRIFFFIEIVVRSLGACIILSYFHLPSLFVMIISFIITTLTTKLYDRTIVKLEEAMMQAQNRISAKVFDVISNITTVIVLRAESKVAEGFWKVLMTPKQTFKRLSLYNEAKWFTTSMYIRFTTCVVVGSYIWQLSLVENAVLIGTIYILFDYVGKVADKFYQITYLYAELIHQAAAVRNAEELTDAFQQQKNVPAVDMHQWNTLTIRSLTFQYDEQSERKSLMIDHLDIHRGERIALVGKSGSGKTTFLKLLRGLYVPSQAHVQLDDAPVSNGLEAIAPHMCLLPQDPELFNATIEENITFGADYEEHTFDTVLDSSAFADVVKRLPYGIQSEIQEKGVNLSGGEKQRLAVARGLLASTDSQILLMDEPTSSVDAHNELHIYKELFTQFKGKTIISSLHRLHLLSLFDRVVFFEQGQIVASGTLHEVLQSTPAFRALWQQYHDTSEMVDRKE